jgi:pimeloyl-ACP methyl ester carboxylesterase
MALQVMDHFGIQKAFVLGTSQGGWIVTRMCAESQYVKCSEGELVEP